MDNFEDIDQAVKLEPMCENEYVEDSSLFIVYGGHVVKDEISEPESPETDYISGPAHMESLMEHSHDVAETEFGMYQASTSSAAEHMESRFEFVNAGAVAAHVGRGRGARGHGRGARGRGRGGRGTRTGVGSQEVARGRGRRRNAEPQPNDSLGLTEEDSARGLQQDVPLERPLPPKRWCIFSLLDLEPSTSSDETKPGPSGPPPASLAGPTASLAGPTAGPRLAGPTRGRSGPASRAPSNMDISSTVPSPTVFEVVEEASTPIPSQYQRPVRDDGIDYGSEDDSDDDYDDDDGRAPTVVPRMHRELFSWDDEEPESQEVKPEPLPASPISNSATTAGYKPNSLFDFEWRSFPNPPVPPTERREVFSDIDCGPTASYRKPYDAFIAIWDREIMEYIVAETNRYAQQVADKQYQDGTLTPNSRIARWTPTNVDELYVFFGYIMAMGICVKGDLKEYWNKEGLFATPNFGHYIAVNRFLLLSRCIHFNNTTNLETMTRPQAKLCKIAPIIKHLNEKFQSLYKLDRNLALDESLTMWKGWLDIKQFMKDKAAVAGIKTFEVCEAQSGYLWRFKVHAGREEEVVAREVTPVSGVIATQVLELLKGLENKGHTVWMDNYYNSPSLARVLKTLGFDCVGTLRTNRQCVPRQLATLQKSDMAVGQLSGCTSGDVDILVWRDQNRVAMISTYHGAGVHTDKDGKTKPISVRDYNLCMGGVDKKDQMLSTYPIERQRTQIWYKKFFRRLLNASVLNAYILHTRCSLPDNVKRVRKHRDFRKELIKDILHHHASKSEEPKSVGILNSKTVLDHFPLEYGFCKDPGRCRERMRRSCVMCHKRIPFYCPTCNVALCISPCHKSYHKDKFLPGVD